jgi:hypothetical protein
MQVYIDTYLGGVTIDGNCIDGRIYCHLYNSILHFTNHYMTHYGYSFCHSLLDLAPARAQRHFRAPSGPEAQQCEDPAEKSVLTATKSRCGQMSSRYELLRL